MEEAPQNSEVNGSRRSFGGMFSGILNKQTSMDTDTSDRLRRGGKVKPGQGGKHLLARSSSSSGGGDVHMAPESPSATSASCPAADWVAAGQDAAMSHHWPGVSPQSHTTPSRGLFSKLLSKKKKASSPAAYSSPSLGASSRGSESPSSHSMEQFPMLSAGDVLPSTPPYKSQSISHDSDAAFGSVYSTPVGSDAMQSPNLQCQEVYGGDTLDLRQVVPQDVPTVFTPGFSQLFETVGGRLHEPDTLQQADDPTVVLVSGTQLEQAGRMYDVPAMLLNAPFEDSDRAAVEPMLSEHNTSNIDNTEGRPTADQQQPVDEMHKTDTAADAPVTNGDKPIELDEQLQLEQEQQQVSMAHVEDVHLAFTSAGGTAAVAQTAGSWESPAKTIAAAVADLVPAQEAGHGVMPTAAAEPAASPPEPACVAVADEDASHAVQAEAKQLSTDSGDRPQEQSQSDAGGLQAVTAGVTWPDPEPSVSDLAAPAQPVYQNPMAAGEGSPAADRMAPKALIAGAVDSESVELSVTASNASEATSINAAEPAALPSAGDTAETDPGIPAGTSPVSAANDSMGCGAEACNLAEEPGIVASSPAAAAMKADELVPCAPTSTSELIAVCQEDEQQGALLAEEQLQQQQQQSHVASVDLSCSNGVSLPTSPAQSESSSRQVLVEHQCEAAKADTAADSETLDSEPVSTECNFASTPPAEEASNVSDASGPTSDTEAAVALPIPEADEVYSEQEPDESDSPPTSASAAAPVSQAATSSHGRGQQPVASSPLRASSARKSRQSPLILVRESMPLFLADPSRAMGSPLAIEEEGLDDQDMQQILSNRLAQHTAASHRPALLAHGGPQRVAVGQFGGGFSSSLEPVAEASFSSAGSPIPEGSPSPGGSTGSRKSSVHMDLQGDMSPLRPRLLNSSPGLNTSAQATPAAGSIGARSPSLAATPGSVYSTPTLAFNGNVACGQGLITPQTGLTDVSVGSAIRQVTPAPVGVLDLSPAVPDMPEASPTLMLLPGGPGLSDTPVNLQGGSGDGTTPSLLDARAASPSAVYATRFMATPFRGALAALPMDAALAAPLVDSSPFQLSDCGMDTVCLADEAQRVAANLAMAAGGFSATPVRTPAATSKAPAACPASAASQGRSAACAGSPTEELRDLHVVMLTKQLAEVQKKVKDVEAENLRLKEQVEIYEFEKTELNSQEEMEKQARQYAEEQLEDMRVEMQRLLQAKNAQSQQILNMQQEFEGRQQEAQMHCDALKQEHTHLANTVAQLQDERNQVLDKLNLVDMQVTALKSSNADLSAAVEAEQQRCAVLEAALAARDRDLAEAGRCSLESQARLEKMMEQMIAANTAKEHARQKAADEAAKVQQLMAEQQQLVNERAAWQEDRKKYATMKQKYSQKAALLKEFELKVQAKEAENQELMSMCDQLLQQQEGRRE